MYFCETKTFSSNSCNLSLERGSVKIYILKRRADLNEKWFESEHPKKLNKAAINKKEKIWQNM